MKLVVQKVSEASVSVDGKKIGTIKKGFMILVGVKVGDTKEDADYLARKVVGLRIFEDEDDKMNLNIESAAGRILSISQFTLLADTKKGNRPSFTQAAEPEFAQEIYAYFNEQLRLAGLKVETGEFGAHMQVQLINDGPTTILFDTENK